MKTVAKAFFLIAVFVCFTKMAFAQVTLDLGVLNQEVAPISESVKPQISKKQLRQMEKKRKAENAIMKKIKPRSKPVQKVKLLQEVITKEEKPPVKIAKITPEVKVVEKPLETKAKVKVAEKPLETKTQVKVAEKPVAPVVPAVITVSKPIKPEIKPVVQTVAVVPQDTKADVEKTLEEKQTKQPDIEFEKTETNLIKLNPFSALFDLASDPDEEVKEKVLTAPKELTKLERSIFLAKDMPKESLTVKELKNRKQLNQVFIFSKGKIDLNDEMKQALNKVANQIKLKDNNRVYVYSYADTGEKFSGKDRQTSLKRALNIRSYLTQQGVASLQIELRSLGQKGAGDLYPNRVDLLVSKSKKRK